MKIDAITPSVWCRVNMPHPGLELEEILDGIIEFSKRYHSKLISETMLVANINDYREEAEKMADLAKRINPLKAYIESIYFYPDKTSSSSLG